MKLYKLNPDGSRSEAAISPWALRESTSEWAFIASGADASYEMAWDVPLESLVNMTFRASVRNMYQPVSIY